MDGLPYDQRLGKRRELDEPLPASWVVARKGRFRTHTAPEQVRIVNVSPTGAGLIAQTVPLFARGTRTELRLDQATAELSIRRIEGVDDGFSFYGVHLVDPPSEFVDLLLERAGAPPREKMESYWNHSS